MRSQCRSQCQGIAGSELQARADARAGAMIPVFYDISFGRFDINEGRESCYAKPLASGKETCNMHLLDWSTERNPHERNTTDSRKNAMQGDRTMKCKSHWSFTRSYMTLLKMNRERTYEGTTKSFASKVWTSCPLCVGCNLGFSSAFHEPFAEETADFSLFQLSSCISNCSTSSSCPLLGSSNASNLSNQMSCQTLATQTKTPWKPPPILPKNEYLVDLVCRSKERQTEHQRPMRREEQLRRGKLSGREALLAAIFSESTKHTGKKWINTDSLQQHKLGAQKNMYLEHLRTSWKWIHMDSWI